MLPSSPFLHVERKRSCSVPGQRPPSIILQVKRRSRGGGFYRNHGAFKGHDKVFSGRQQRQMNYKIQRFGDQFHFHHQSDLVMELVTSP